MSGQGAREPAQFTSSNVKHRQPGGAVLSIALDLVCSFIHLFVFQSLCDANDQRLLNRLRSVATGSVATGSTSCIAVAETSPLSTESNNHFLAAIREKKTETSARIKRCNDLTLAPLLPR